LRELDRIRRVSLDNGERSVEVLTRRNGLQARVLDAFGVDTKDWNRAHIE
jgi:hypothetical protein